MNALFSKTILTASAAAALATTMIPLAAQAGEIANQLSAEQSRIAQGVRDGQMTRREFDYAEGRLQQIAAQRRHDLRMNGGHLTPFEAARLNRELRRESETVFFDKHNIARQPGAPLI